MSTKLNYFDVDEAVLFGVNGSVILNHIRSWIFKNKSSNRNFHDGHYWTYNSIAGFKQYYPYFSEKQISTILIKLEKEGVLISGNYNKLHFDRTKWYCINEPLIRERKLTLKSPALVVLENGYIEGANEQFDSFLQENCILPFGKMEDTKKENENLPNGKMTFYQMGETIPDNKTNNKTIKIERGQNEKFCPPSLSDVVDFFKKRNITASAENFFNHWESVGWKKSKGQQILKWESLVPKWVKDELPAREKIKVVVTNAQPKKPTQERQQLIENFKKETWEFVGQLRADSSLLETYKIKLDKECAYKFELHSQTVYTMVERYQNYLILEPHLLSEDSLRNVSLKNFKINFFEWLKKQKFAPNYFSETKNRYHGLLETQQ